MQISNYIKSLNIGKQGTFSDNDGYIIDIMNSDEFAKMESILEKNDKLEIDDDLTQIDENSEYTVFIDEESNVQLSLIGSFEEDSYRLVVKELA